VLRKSTASLSNAVGTVGSHGVEEAPKRRSAVPHKGKEKRASATKAKNILTLFSFKKGVQTGS
jgi:hypothetical protein